MTLREAILGLLGFYGQSETEDIVRRLNDRGFNSDKIEVEKALEDMEKFHVVVGSEFKNTKLWLKV